MFLIFVAGCGSAIGGLPALVLFPSVASVAHLSKTSILVINFVLRLFNPGLRSFKVLLDLALLGLSLCQRHSCVCRAAFQGIWGMFHWTYLKLMTPFEFLVLFLLDLFPFTSCVLERLISLEGMLRSRFGLSLDRLESVIKTAECSVCFCYLVVRLGNFIVKCISYLSSSAQVEVATTLAY